jgi:hypothetical protein
MSSISSIINHQSSRGNGLFVLGGMNDIANCDAKHKAYPVANCDHLKDHHEVPIWNLK